MSWEDSAELEPPHLQNTKQSWVLKVAGSQAIVSKETRSRCAQRQHWGETGLQRHEKSVQLLSGRGLDILVEDSVEIPANNI